MKWILTALLSPGWNRVILIGFILMIVGIILTPLLIGIPIGGVGFSLVAVGAMVTVLNYLPGGKRVVSEFDSLLKTMVSFLEKLVHEVVH